MFPFVQEIIHNLIQRHIDVGQKLLEGHWAKPGFLNPIPSIEPDSYIPTTSSSTQPQTSNDNDDSLIDQLSDHYKGELPSFVANLEKASEIASDEVILESPQQQQSEQRPISPNLTQQESQLPEQSDSDANTLVSEDQTLVESQIIVALPALDLGAAIDPQPISVALPSDSTEAIPNPQPTLEQNFEIIHVSNAKVENPIQTGLTLDSSLPFVLKHVHDPPFEPNQSAASEIPSTDAPSPSTTIIPQLSNVLRPPTILLDSTILQEVC